MLFVPLLVLAITVPFNPDANEPDTLVWLNWFSSEDAVHTRVALNNARIYAPRFREIFEAEGVPQNLIWIAWVESHFKPEETSITGARGIYQFKAETASFLGLTVNRKRDDRNVPHLAARAAARYLVYLFERFPDWDLVLAAYNLGEGDLRRTMQRVGAVTWPEVKPHVRQQTRDYVGKVKAAVILGNQFMSRPEAEVVGRVYRVRRGDNLYQIARKFGIDAAKIRRANSIVEYDIYPGELLILPGLAPEQPGNLEVYTVVKGDTLRAIARRFEMSVAALKQINGLTSDQIHPGQTLRVSSLVTHVVEPGDTLYGLSRRFGITVADLKESNNLESDKLKPGQKLNIPKQ